VSGIKNLEKSRGTATKGRKRLFSGLIVAALRDRGKRHFTGG
jgi:hypothetical protein